MRSCGALSLALCLALSVARAQVPVDALEEHLRRGVALRSEGRDEEAVASFTAALALRREPRVVAQLGLANQALGRWLVADALLREALSASADPWVTRNRAALASAEDVVERHLARVELVGDVAGARVRVNGAEVGVLPLPGPVRVVAGSVAIEVNAEGHETSALRFVAAAGETLRERVTLVPLRAPEPPVVPPPAPPPAVVPSPVVPPPAVLPTASRSEPPAPWRALSIGAFAGGGAFVAGGVLALVLRELATTDYNNACAPGEAAGICGETRDRAALNLGAALGALPAGAALLAVGTVFAVRDRAERPRVAVGVGAAGVHCRIAF